MNLELSDDSYQCPTNTQLHYTIANISLHKLYQIARGSSSSLRQHVLIRNLLMCGSFDMVLNAAAPPTTSLQITAAPPPPSPSAPPSDEDVWLERCFDDLTDTDDDMEEGDARATDLSDEPPPAAVPNSWMYTSNYRLRHQREQDNALVPSLRIPQQMVLVIPFSQLRDTIASKEAIGSIVAPDDPASTDKNVPSEKRQLNHPAALIEWSGGNWPMY